MHRAARAELETNNMINNQKAKSIQVNTWQELEEQLFFDSYWNELHRYRTKFLFRGLSSSEYNLDTNIQRMRADPPLETKELLLLRQFQKYAHRDVIERDTIWHWLSIANHHGLPTRLLDWTNSPFVALHFATANAEHFGLDGVVWAVHFAKVREHLPKKLKDALDATPGANVFTVAELAKVVNKLEDLENMKEGKDFMVIFEPPSIDDRIVNQYALLTAMSNVNTIPGDWLEKFAPECYRKIVINKDLKPEIRDRLDMMNMTERVFLPGLDGLTLWLGRYYGPSLHKQKEGKNG
jgi:hypothetical protein